LNNIKDLTKYDNIKGMLTGRDCFIVGSGPSLIGFDFSKLDDKFTIGVNHIIEHYDNLDCLLFGDRIFVKTNEYDLDKFPGKIFMSEETSWQGEMSHIIDKENTYIFEKNRSCVSNNLVSDGLFHPTNSGFMAMNLALIMGARKIYLLGFDFKYRGSQMHFYTNKDHHNRYPEKKFQKKLDKIIHFAKYKDKFINLSLESELNLFEKKSIDEVI